MKPRLLPLLCVGLTCAQSTPEKQRETLPDLVALLTPEQKGRLDGAMRNVSANNYAEALVVFKQMMAEVPSDPVLVKLATEAALNSKDVNFALTNLKPLAAADADDWQAAAPLTRACAEAGDAPCRDAGIEHMLDLHKRGITPPRLQQYLLERVSLGDNILVIQTSLEPWGRFHIYDQGQLLDKDNKVTLRMTLETDDWDQELFAKQHPLEAAAGQRRFSFDGYRDNPPNSSGQKTQTHFTFKMLDGQPAYSVVREAFLKIANNQQPPVTSGTKPVGQ